MKVGDKLYTEDSAVSYEATEADVRAYEARAARNAASQSAPEAAQAHDPEAVAALIKAAEDATLWLADLNTASGDTIKMRLERAIEDARPKAAPAHEPDEESGLGM